MKRFLGLVAMVLGLCFIVVGVDMILKDHTSVQILPDVVHHSLADLGLR